MPAVAASAPPGWVGRANPRLVPGDERRSAGSSAHMVDLKATSIDHRQDQPQRWKPCLVRPMSEENSRVNVHPIAHRLRSTVFVSWNVACTPDSNARTDRWEALCAGRASLGLRYRATWVLLSDAVTSNATPHGSGTIESLRFMLLAACTASRRIFFQ